MYNILCSSLGWLHGHIKEEHADVGCRGVHLLVVLSIWISHCSLPLKGNWPV